MSEFTTTDLESATSGAAFVAVQIAKIFGPIPQAAAAMLTGEVSWAASMTDLGAKMSSGNATWGDVVDVTLKTEVILAAGGVLLGLPAAGLMASIASAAAGAWFIWNKKEWILAGADYAENLARHQVAVLENNIRLTLGLPGISAGAAPSFSMPTITQSRRLFQESQFTSPLILDLDGNGVVATTGLGSGTFFDHDGNGLAESTGWVGSGDALLVRDLNGNGRIDDGNELFGNHTDLAPGVNSTNAANGFAALATLDANGDGQVNAQDGSGWSSLRLWRDLNGNGLSEAGELVSLQDAGISSLGTAYSGNANPTDAQGNQHRQLGSFTRTDGSTGAMHDVWFAADPVIQRDANPVAVNETIAALPDMQGLGNVRSLRQAMARACVRSVRRGWDRPYKHEHRRQACAHQPGREHYRRDQDRPAKSHRIPAQSGATGWGSRVCGSGSGPASLVSAIRTYCPLNF